MTKISTEAAQAVSHAKAAVGEDGRRGGRLAARLTRTTVKHAGKTVARAQRQATDAAGKVVPSCP